MKPIDLPEGSGIAAGQNTYANALAQIAMTRRSATRVRTVRVAMWISPEFSVRPQRKSGGFVGDVGFVAGAPGAAGAAGFAGVVGLAGVAGFAGAVGFAGASVGASAGLPVGSGGRGGSAGVVSVGFVPGFWRKDGGFGA